MDQEADCNLAPSLQRLPQGAKYGGGGSRNVPKVHVGVAPHAFIHLKRPRTFCAMRAVRQKVGTLFRQPKILVHDMTHFQKTLTVFGTACGPDTPNLMGLRPGLEHVGARSPPRARLRLPSDGRPAS